MSETDIVERLRKPYLDREDIMNSWDAIRKYLLDGNLGSYPRDVFESILSQADEDREEAADLIATLKASLSTAEAERDEARKKVIEECALIVENFAAGRTMTGEALKPRVVPSQTSVLIATAIRQLKGEQQ